MNRFKNQSGQALVLVMMIMLLLLLMGSSMLTQGSESRKASFEESKMVQAYYVADAGVEKAMARIKNDPFWLKGLPYNTDIKYIGSPDGIFSGTPFPYIDGGQITSVTVKRTSFADNPTTFYIKSLGQYQDARRTIEIEGKMYDPVNLPAGVTVNFPSTFANNSVINSDVTSTDELIFTNNSNVSGVITAVGNVSLENNMSATKVVTGGDLILANNVQITMDVDVAGDVILYNNAKITGNVNAVGDVILSNNAIITGDVYYNGTLTMGSGASTGALHPDEAEAVNVDPAPFPVLDQDWYARNADHMLNGNLAGSFNVDGISYTPGDISISGTYSGNGAIIAGGKVSINNNLNRADDGSSLAVISFGNVNGVGIEVSKNITAYALLYSPNKIVIDNNANFHGSVMCNVVDVSNNATVTYEDFLQQNQPDWITTGVSITSWKEQFSVF
ncbi:MAG: polymer-forming cytoskeletal protein [Desulfotomaculaceae bacterium]|nr:polymer-forming cytoskeletal protein [Desulfotomaculaceae bacterium]